MTPALAWRWRASERGIAVEVARFMGLSMDTVLKAERREGVKGVFASERTRRREGVFTVDIDELKKSTAT